MTKNPIINALLATAYIALVASIMFYAPKFAGKNETLLIPIAVISLFSLSAAVMGYLFLGTPAQLFLTGKKKEAVNLFLKTIGAFAIITALVFITIFTRLIK